jgi:hypothetical protein
VNAGKFVTDRCKKRQDREFRPDTAGRIAGPIDLRPGKMKTVLVKVARYRGDIALPPTPVIDVRQVDENQPSRYGPAVGPRLRPVVAVALGRRRARVLKIKAPRFRSEAVTEDVRWNAHPACVMTVKVKSTRR